MRFSYRSSRRVGLRQCFIESRTVRFAGRLGPELSLPECEAISAASEQFGVKNRCAQRSVLTVAVMLIAPIAALTQRQCKNIQRTRCVDRERSVPESLVIARYPT